MAEEKDTGLFAGLVIVIFLLAGTLMLGMWMVQNRFQTGCEDRCYPLQMESMKSATGCICAEAK